MDDSRMGTAIYQLAIEKHNFLSMSKRSQTVGIPRHKDVSASVCRRRKIRNLMRLYEQNTKWDEKADFDYLEPGYEYPPWYCGVDRSNVFPGDEDWNKKCIYVCFSVSSRIMHRNVLGGYCLLESSLFKPVTEGLDSGACPGPWSGVHPSDDFLRDCQYSFPGK